MIARRPAFHIEVGEPKSFGPASGGTLEAYSHTLINSPAALFLIGGAIYSAIRFFSSPESRQVSIGNEGLGGLEPVRGLLLGAMTRVYNVEHATEEAIAHHQEVLDCIRAKDAERAREAMRSHLDQFERVLKKALSLTKRQPQPG